ncbi:protein kinase family protein [Trichococcus collinsii]|uniref:Protein kinase domain-containing protein n=1 Tax=Trichococcus collinsii TaxID=157076 RepID=A0AB37ZWQ4_9LACT|nr:protein kinase family protein [Trichococcus collinsii]CZQ82290.1 tyrosine-protein kinase active site [Trichococcus collinsii]SDZ87662.1 Protein kinase domain-containing protein [Trichococcus collinsii]
MNLKYYLNKVNEENAIDEYIREEELYEDIEDDSLRNFLALSHHELNRLLIYLNSRLSNGYYTAAESRELIHWIKLIEDSNDIFTKTGMDIRINPNYLAVLRDCKKFLQHSSGSAIPSDFNKVEIIEYEPIYSHVDTTEVKHKDNITKYPLKLIGEGSYAKVFKYKDDFYNKCFVVKKANKDLNEKEKDRFKREFEIMKALKSPYVIEVYQYNDSENEYTMECADETLHHFISTNNNKIKHSERVSLVNQILRGFEYIHSKGYLHRDISFTNILIQRYDDINIIKISDFGLVKTRESTLTSVGTEFKGSLNDGVLQVIGFDKYDFVHETYALTRLIFFIMTGKMNLEGMKEGRMRKFVEKGTHPDTSQRYQSIQELKASYRKVF